MPIWCVADHTGEERSQCPLLEELGAISRLNEQSVILIHDVQAIPFCPPPPLHEVTEWPSLESVLKCLHGLSPAHELMVLNDVIICYPADVSEALLHYAYDHSINWLTALNKSRDYDLLLAQSKEKEALIQEKEAVIRELVEACEARLSGMKSLSAELERERRQS